MLIEGSTRRETETRTITLQGKYKRTAYARSFGRELTGYTVKINRNQKPTNYKLLWRLKNQKKWSRQLLRYWRNEKTDRLRSCHRWSTIGSMLGEPMGKIISRKRFSRHGRKRRQHRRRSNGLRAGFIWSTGGVVILWIKTIILLWDWAYFGHCMPGWCPHAPGKESFNLRRNRRSEAHGGGFVCDYFLALVQLQQRGKRPHKPDTIS